jgi:DNA-binding transcriptional ArsR family regulator
MKVNDDCCDMFKALSAKTRVRILEALKSKGPLGAKKIALIVGVTPAAVSQHLKVLKQAGLVRSERRGYRIPYQVDVEAMQDCQSKLVEVCACRPGDACGPTKVMLMKRKKPTLKQLEAYKKRLERELEAVEERIEKLAARKGE